MLEIAEFLEPAPTELWPLLQQIGVTQVVGAMTPQTVTSSTPTEIARPGSGQGTADAPWEYEQLARVHDLYARHGFEVAVIEDYPPLERARQGLAGRDEEIAWFQTQIRSMGRLGIRALCYHWMAVFSWLRTSTTVPERGAALVSQYDHAVAATMPAVGPSELTEERLWENLQYFLERVVPVAEEAGVRLAIHPDDPPISPVRGVPRILRSLDGLQRAIDLVPSEANGITLCQGNVALMTDDLPGAIRHFGGQGRVNFVHFRDVRGTPEAFTETFHDNGPTDMEACLRAYSDTGVEGVLRPDHVPTMAGEDNDRPGYASLGRLYAVGYIRGLQERIVTPPDSGAPRR